MKASISVCILLFIATAMTFPQSSFYALNSRTNTYPQVLPHYGSNDDTNLGNRFGENDNSSSTASSSTTSTTATTVTAGSSNPGDSIHDPAIVNIVSGWPKDRLPFWLLNAQHINSHRGRPIPCTNCNNAQPSAQQPQTKSFFAGNSN